jgi:hypothetical protein
LAIFPPLIEKHNLVNIIVLQNSFDFSLKYSTHPPVLACASAARQTLPRIPPHYARGRDTDALVELADHGVTPEALRAARADYPDLNTYASGLPGRHGVFQASIITKIVIIEV